MSSKLITYSSELMSNFKQAEVASAEAKFEALQTDDGNALLFSVGTDGVFYVTQETPGQATGWDKTDLSTMLKRDFGGQTPKTRTFAVSQNRKSGKIDLALVVTVPDNDYLYLSLDNSASDTGWVSNPSWVRFPYDDTAHPLSKVSVVNVFISQASDGEYIAVDTLRNPTSGVQVVFRHFIDPTKKLTGQAWNPHDVSTDLDASKVSSCLGRRQGDKVDGLYTLGQIGGHTSLIYQPLYNPFKPKIPANPARLILPEGSAPSAIAAVAMSDSDNATDLYVACDKSLYYFPADAQKDNAQGVKVLDHPIIEKVDRLFAFASPTQVIIWGLNRADQVFYTACDRAQIRNPAAWSYPLPILQNVEQLSPYVNRADNGNTFFAHTGLNQLQKAVQDPETTTWKFENILLPALVTAKAQKFNSYTTRVQVTDETKKPLAGVPVNLSSSSRAGVYINNLYYVLDPTPIPVETDHTGGLVIVEWVDGLRATQLQVRGDGGAPIEINPMAKPFQKAASLNTKEKLSAAVIKRQDGSTKPLIDSATSDGDKQIVAGAISNLLTAYQSLPPAGAPKLAAASAAAEEAEAPALASVPTANIMSFRVGADAAAAVDLGEGFMDFSDAITVAAGDLLKFLSSQVEYVFHVVKDALDKAWHFVVEIADKTYRFALDAAEKIVGALEHIFKAIKTALEDLVDYLKFLFDWDDFVRTKDVFKRLLLLHFGLVLDQVGEFKEDFNALITKAKHSVDDWAGIKHDDWQPGVKHSDQPLGFLRTLFDYGQAFSAPGMFLSQHFIDNVHHARSTTDASTNVLDDLINRVIQALEDQGDVLVGAANRIRTELLDDSRYEALTLGEVLKKLTAIVVDALLNTTENVVDLLIDVFVILARAAVAALDTPIRIPVVSDILEDIGVKVESTSILDVVCMIGAVPATLAYKGIFNRAPFSPGDGFSDKILNSKDVYALRDAFAGVRLATDEGAVVVADTGGGAQPLARADVSGGNGSSSLLTDSDKKASDFVPVKIPKPWQSTVYMVGHLLGGIVSVATAVLVIAEAKKGSMGPQYETASGVSGAVGAVMVGLPSVLAAPYPIQHPVMSKISSTCSGATLLGKIAFKIAPSAIAKKRGITDAGEKEALAETMKKIGSGFDALIAVIALVPTCYHFYELSKYEASKERTEVIIDETSNVCNYLGRVTGFAVQVVEAPKVKLILAAVQGGLIISYGGLQMAEAFSEAAG
ncbi:MAG: hypothetical protein DMF64_00545 [Acidobacteria bacterium]|nr:MAG: hypothetical protein DMF64_00545 [Acidobacteriota bacterium]